MHTILDSRVQASPSVHGPLGSRLKDPPQSSGHTLYFAILFTLSIFRLRGQFSLGVASIRKIDSDETEVCSDVYSATAASQPPLPASQPLLLPVSLQAPHPICLFQSEKTQQWL